ncbi:hypothetical protein [Mesorhizobium sp. ANAO-SY3R2]|uniref:hypothetical protein n=1 Tax=Mesorhizobium sp. ANAO-SY3R2 TaxID=3166644 RepID=UPI00366ED23C
MSDDDDARRQLVELGLTTLRRRAVERDKLAAAVLAIAGDDMDAAHKAFERIPGATGSSPGSDTLALSCMDDVGPIGGLYGAAVVADSELREQHSALLLAVRAGTDESAHEALLGLAVLALRRNLFKEADALVTACLSDEPMHPRAGSIFAICELERGHSASGQAYLAAACRHARRARYFRNELQIAQRALLLIHLQ